MSFDFVVQGLPSPFGDEQNRREWDRHMRLRAKHTCMLARSFADAGFVVVVDDFVTQLGDVARYAKCLERSLGLVVLAPPLEAIAARDAGRDKHVFDAWKHKDAELRDELVGHGLWVQDPELNPDQVADAISVDPAATMYRRTGQHA